MERIWLKQYPAGVPADIDVTQYASLVELLEESFKKFADRKAFICMDKAISQPACRYRYSWAYAWRPSSAWPERRHRRIWARRPA